MNPVPVACFGPSRDLTDDQIKPACGVVRIKAIGESRLWCTRPEQAPQGSGALLGEGEKEYVKVPPGYFLQVEGTVNITEVY